MVRGIRFKIPNDYGKYIGDILSKIDINEYIWEVIEDDVIIDSKTYLFDKEIYKGKDFFEIINNETYYIMFLNIRAYSNLEERIEINTYLDFLNSGCEILINVCDSSFVEIYVKKYELVERFKLVVEKYKYEDMELITEGNDIIFNKEKNY